MDGHSLNSQRCRVQNEVHSERGAAVGKLTHREVRKNAIAGAKMPGGEYGCHKLKKLVDIP